MTNLHSYGDKLEVLRQHIANQSNDLVYLDAPVTSNRSLNVHFANRSGGDAQVVAHLPATVVRGPDATALEPRTLVLEPVRSPAVEVLACKAE